MNPEPGLQNPSPPSVPEATSTPRPPPDSGPDPRILKRLRDERLRVLSKRFGNIPGVPIFAEWDKRIECSNSAVHRSIMAGICGSGKIGAYSIALSSLYKDDEDGGDIIIYTGAGGREKWTDTFPPKRLRMGPQTQDQSWDTPSNKALIISLHTGNPVRVIRSWKCPSQYAPLTGYRYDGLYKVTDYWTAKGLSGKNICRCRLERLPNQPPIPLREITFSASGRRQRRYLMSHFTSGSSTFVNEVAVEPNQTHTSEPPAQLGGSTTSESRERPSPPQQAMILTSTLCEPEANVRAPESPSHGRSSVPGDLPRYKWDSKRHTLVRVSGPGSIQERLDAAWGGEEEHHGEDDATLVSSEDGRRVNDPERIGAEYFSDEGH